jgi:hypothetical protein
MSAAQGVDHTQTRREQCGTMTTRGRRGGQGHRRDPSRGGVAASPPRDPRSKEDTSTGRVPGFFPFSKRSYTEKMWQKNWPFSEHQHGVIDKRGRVGGGGVCWSRHPAPVVMPTADPLTPSTAGTGDSLQTTSRQPNMTLQFAQNSPVEKLRALRAIGNVRTSITRLPAGGGNAREGTQVERVWSQVAGGPSVIRKIRHFLVC